MRRIAETVFAAGVSALLALGYVIFVGRRLGPADYADFSAALSVIYFFAMALTPVTPTLARVIAAAEARGDAAAVSSLRRAVIRRALLIASIVAILGLVVSPLVATLLHFESAATFALATTTAALFALLSVDRGVLQGLLMFHDYNASTIVETGVRLAGTLVIFSFAAASTPRALVSYGAGMIAAELIVAARLRARSIDSKAPVDWQPLTRLATPMVALMIAIAVFQNADMLAVKRWFAAEASGNYGAATALARTFGVLFVPLYVIAGPTLTRAFETKRPIVKPAVQLTLLFLLLSLIPLLVVIVWPRQIVTLLYGVAFDGAAPLIAPLGAIAILTYCSLMLAQVLITASEFGFLRLYGIVAACEVVALLFVHATVRDVILVVGTGQAIVLAGMIAMTIRYSALYDAKLHVE